MGAQVMEHRDRLHTWPVPHARPQAAQLLVSVARSTQAPLQAVWVPGHCTWQTPDTHIIRLPHALPQAPQLALSLAVSTQREPHWVCMGVHTAGTSMEPSLAPPSPPTTLLPTEQPRNTEIRASDQSARRFMVAMTSPREGRCQSTDTGA